MDPDNLLYAQIFVARAKDTEEAKHDIRLFYAKKARDALEAFIAEEIKTANSEPVKSPSHLSWAEIGKIFNLSKTAVFTKYGSKK